MSGTSFFPSKTTLMSVASSHPYRSLDGALSNMAGEFDARAAELNATSDDCRGHVRVLGKRIAEDYEFEWLVEDGTILFREVGADEWGSCDCLCNGAFDLNITRMVFTEAVHSHLWWALEFIALKYSEVA